MQLPALLLQLLATTTTTIWRAESAATVADQEFLKQVLRNVNYSVNPCEDFYSYACGKWSEHYNDTQYYLDMPGYMDYKYNSQLLQVLQQQQHAGGIYQMLWSYFVSCRDLPEPAFNELLHKLEAQLQMEWPIFRGNHSEMWHNETQFDWLATLAKLRLIGLNDVFFKLDVDVQRHNGSHYVLLLLPQTVAATQFEQQSIYDLYKAFGVADSTIDNLTLQLMQLEWQVTNLTWQLQESNYLAESSLPELQERLPQINWSHYFAQLLPHYSSYLLQASMLHATYLQQLLQIFSQTANATICDYLMFKLMYALNAELPQADHATRGISCVLQLRGHMPLATNYIYETHFYGHKRQATDAAVQHLQQQLCHEFELLLQQNHLQLNQVEQSFIREELQQLRLKIGNLPPQLTMPQVLQYYQELNLQPDDFYGNKLQLLQFYVQHELKLLHNQPTWDYVQQEASVARSSSPVKIFQNIVLLPHAYLQLPLYDAGLTTMLQHAQLGFMLAHELQHAFDLFHIVYDARLNWNATGLDILQHFENFTSCYTSLYNVPHALLSETMSDIVGLQLAFASYFDHSATVPHTHEKHTESQLFFINSVQLMCANMQQIAAMNVAQDLEHGLHNERVNRNWPQHEHFASTFNCTVGQNMYTPHKCRLW